MKMYELNRDVTRAECFWLHRDYKKGERVYLFPGHTYGCITPAGLPCSEQPGQIPFFELPTDALRELVIQSEVGPQQCGSMGVEEPWDGYKN